LSKDAITSSTASFYLMIDSIILFVSLCFCKYLAWSIKLAVLCPKSGSLYKPSSISLPSHKLCISPLLSLSLWLVSQSNNFRNVSSRRCSLKILIFHQANIPATIAATARTIVATFAQSARDIFIIITYNFLSPPHTVALLYHAR